MISTYDFIKDKAAKTVPNSFKKKPDETKLRFVVAFFFMVILLLIILAQIFHAEYKGQVSKKKFKFNSKNCVWAWKLQFW